MATCGIRVVVLRFSALMLRVYHRLLGGWGGGFMTLQFLRCLNPCSINLCDIVSGPNAQSTGATGVESPLSIGPTIASHYAPRQTRLAQQLFPLARLLVGPSKIFIGWKIHPDRMLSAQLSAPLEGDVCTLTVRGLIPNDYQRPKSRPDLSID